MIDREKVIKGLRFCFNETLGLISCDGCVYSDSRTVKNGVTHCYLVDDAMDLLKEQEAEWVYGEDETGVDGWHCSECNFFEPWFYEFDDDIDFIKRYEHCPKCGRRMTSYTGKQEGR